MALINKLTAIADAIRGKTGKTEEMTLDQMVTEIAGIQSGIAYDMGDIVLDVDVIIEKNIPHNLGSVPDFVMVWTDDFSNRDIPTDYDDNVGFIFMRDLPKLPQRVTSAITSNDGLTIGWHRSKNDSVNRCTFVVPSAVAYMYPDTELTSETFNAKNNGTMARWRAGVTYHYFVAKAWWNLTEVTA